MNLVKASLKHKQVTLSVLLLMFCVGVYSLLNMPRREDPKITIRQGLVIAYYPGADAAQVEDQVTDKLEQYLFQFAEVRKEKTYSDSRDGLVVVHVELNEDVKRPDVFWNKLKHKLLVARQLDLPDGVRGPLVNSDFGDTEAMIIGVESSTKSYTQLKKYTEQLEDRIRQISSVSKIKRIGERRKQILVTANSQKLSQYGISLQQVVNVLQSQNVIGATGDLKTDKLQVPLYTKGYYEQLKDVANQVVGTSKTGEVVRLGDIAKLKRGYTEAQNKISVNGQKAMLLAIQMHEGHNIVDFGQEVKHTIHEVSPKLPPDVQLTTVFNQPDLVQGNVSHFIREFFIAIIAVIIVVVLLLPFRISLVAATAIPMTVAVTFALMHTFGIELQQVSLAALIVVLGMVVDDAIVVADNYVELLDQGVDRYTAAWRSATDLVVPILAATITIIASFMPMVLLTGSIGEFIHALPVTVAIALASSFIVAMVLTPMLCLFFIKQGLHGNPEHETGTLPKGSLLDWMQSLYDQTLDWCVDRPWLTIGFSLVPIALAILLYTSVINQKFFPAAERNQFVVELWMPTQTKLEKTERSVKKIAAVVKADKRVTSYATFVGTSAPRFYYNYAPQFPVTNYAQLLINTTNEEATESFSKELSQKVNRLVPEGRPHVKLMQQGMPLHAEVEVRVVGDDIRKLKEMGNKVEKIIRNTKGSRLVREDFKEDYYGLDIHLKNEAERLGFTTESVSRMIYTAFNGATISTIHQGQDPIDIVFRVDKKNRRNLTDLKNLYVASPATGARLPLQQIAEISPQWQTGNIMHRNGVRTLTVQSETTDGMLPSELLNAIRPQIKQLALPAGYHIEYGGEHENRQETFSQMLTVLFISLILIFFILLFQFRNIKEAVIVMLTIPLSLFGAMMGLVITGNNFGFTAFVGLISLSGIVVRNAIILIDHTNELIKEGVDIRSAAIQGGKRRLRPIFLTAMAAAIGVVPMILSGSSLWSPLASVIAAGVIWSMLMALVTVPVIYLMWIKPHDKQELLSSSKNVQPNA